MRPSSSSCSCLMVLNSLLNFLLLPYIYSCDVFFNGSITNDCLDSGTQLPFIKRAKKVTLLMSSTLTG